MPADFSQPRPSVPDLLRDPCVHDQPPCGSCGEDHIRPDARDCDDCIRLALAAAKAEGRREGLEEAAAYLLAESDEPMIGIDTRVMHRKGAFADAAAAIRGLSRAGTAPHEAGE